MELLSPAQLMHFGLTRRNEKGREFQQILALDFSTLSMHFKNKDVAKQSFTFDDLIRFREDPNNSVQFQIVLRY